MTYKKKEPTYEVVLFDGTDTTADLIRDLTKDINLSLNVYVDNYYIHYNNKNPQKKITISQGDYYNPKKVVTVYPEMYFAIRNDGKYYAFTEDDFKAQFEEV